MTTTRGLHRAATALTIALAFCNAGRLSADCNRSEGAQKIAVFFDGTWNDSSTQTNILRLWKEVEAASTATGSPHVHSHYRQGIGSDWRKWSGGATGYGFARNVRDGYRFIAECYEPGDKVYIFGFSRGAFTARMLAATIQQVGILNRKAFMTQRRDGHRELDSSAFRNAVEEAYKITKSAGKEAVFKRTGQWPSTLSDSWRRTSSTEAIAALTASRKKRNPAEPVLYPASLEVVGVWDTVGALGLQHDEKELRYLVNLEDLPSLRRAYQALSVDEDRRSFQPVPWSGSSGAGEGRVLEEVWFPGAHADVGGGYGSNPDLADLSLHWMASKLADDGLVRPDFAQLTAAQRETLAKARRHHPRQPGDTRPRAPEANAWIHASVCDRMRASEDERERGGDKSPDDKGPYRPAGIVSDSGTIRTDLRFVGWDGKPGSCLISDGR